MDHVRKSKALIELNLDRDIKGNKKSIYGSINTLGSLTISDENITFGFYFRTLCLTLSKMTCSVSKIPFQLTSKIATIQLPTSYVNSVVRGRILLQLFNQIWGRIE